MRYKLIACKALSRELSYLSALSDHVIDITWIRQGYHNTPEVLHDLLQEEIDAIEAGTDKHTNMMNDYGNGNGVAADFDAILLGYGLCSNATTGLTARQHRLIIPKAHDCITLYLGSKERYTEWFEKLPGCFWYTADWIDNSDMPGKERTERMTAFFAEQGYDEDTIEFLLEEMGGLRNYHHLGYIPLDFYDHEKYHQIAKEAAAYHGWEYHEVPGSMRLMEQLISGQWDEKDFLVLEPGESAAQSYDADVLKKA